MAIDRRALGAALLLVFLFVLALARLVPAAAPRALPLPNAVIEGLLPASSGVASPSGGRLLP